MAATTKSAPCSASSSTVVADSATFLPDHSMALRANASLTSSACASMSIRHTSSGSALSLSDSRMSPSVAGQKQQLPAPIITILTLRYSFIHSLRSGFL